uniref:Trypsin n=1 Tax=Euphausia superba TaxID=6819 RepID=A0A1D8QLQ4_EUPSU|nr:trypsin [Euphausia superba]
MRSLLVLLVSITVAAAFPRVQEIPLEYRLPDNRIVGGVIAEDGEFPWQISMQHKGLFGYSHMCGGSVHSENYIITAGHCTDGQNAAKILVIAGTNVLSDLTGAEVQQIAADELVHHEHYDSSTITNDISLIHLSTPLVMNAKVQPVPLPDQMDTIEAGTECIISGWGTLHEGALGLPDNLMKVTVPVVTDEVCREAYSITQIGDGMICAGLDEGGKDSCQGDSGGPFVCDGVLHGVVSWGRGCAEPHYPGVYTEVAYYRDWIDAHAV